MDIPSTLRSMLVTLKKISASEADFQDIAMLDAIASTAAALAQDLYLEQDALMAQIDSIAAHRAEMLVAESDVMDRAS